MITQLQQHLFKIYYDGNDIVTRFPERPYNDFEISHSLNNTIINEFPKKQEFFEYCIAQGKLNSDKLPIPVNLQEKYNIGYYKPILGLNFHDDYICFSDSLIKKFKEVKTEELEFMVAFSFDQNNEIFGIGLRILNSDIVFNAFKWLFPLGQHCIFGLHDLDNSKEVILVEGFTDYIAARESGYNNVLGLGSIEITEGHKKYLPKDRNYKFCYDQDRYGYEMRKVRNECFFSPMEYKDPYEAYINTGKVEFILVE